MKAAVARAEKPKLMVISRATRLGQTTRKMRHVEKNNKPVVPSSYDFNLIQKLGPINGLEIPENPELKNHECQVLWLNPRKQIILIDYNSQRQLEAPDISLAKEIGETFDWAQFKVPTLCKAPNGDLYCTDGQLTTLMAIYHDLEIPFFIFPATQDMLIARLAGSFIGVNSNRRIVRSTDMFSALVFRGDEQEASLAKVLIKHGITPVSHFGANNKYKALETTSINIIRAIYQNHDRKTFEVLCKIIVAAQFRPIRRNHLWALNLLMYRHEPTSIDVARMGNAIRSILDRHALLEAAEARKKSKDKTSVPAELVKIYERRYRQSSQALDQA